MGHCLKRCWQELLLMMQFFSWLQWMYLWNLSLYLRSIHCAPCKIHLNFRWWREENKKNESELHVSAFLNYCLHRVFLDIVFIIPPMKFQYHKHLFLYPPYISILYIAIVWTFLPPSSTEEPIFTQLEWY